MGSGPLPEITVCQHSFLYNLRVQVKEAICQHDPETPAIFSLRQSSSKMMEGKKVSDQA